ncbi:MAG TPA: phosphotransferase, partial [Trebonia sp.]|nr:phosphotransferase [Trebonia sp.]
GRVRASRSANAGTNAAITAFLDTEDGRVLLKGVPKAHPAARDQQREADVNPYIRGIGPRMFWCEEAAGWHLLGFEVIEARCANYAPGSPDLPKIGATLTAVAELPCPPVAMLSAGRRWGPYLDRIEDQQLIAGDCLLHTDPNPGNVLVTEERAWLVDWAWSTRGAAFIDLVCLLPRLVAAGHSPAEAEDWAARHPVWQEADRAAVTVFSLALARLVRKLADDDPAAEWRQPMVKATHYWAQHRSGSTRV